MTAGVLEMLTPTQVAQRLAELSRLLDGCQRELVAADERAVRSRQRYEVGFAKSFLAGVGSVDARKQQAVIDCADAHLDAEIADQQVRALRSRLSVLRDQVEIGRSLGAAVRSEWAAS